jgi:hypothetical protein
MTQNKDQHATETEVQLGEVFAQSRQNAEQLQNLGTKLDAVIVEFRRAIEQTQERAERMFDQVRRAASPNMGNIWMGIGVAISFVALLGTAFGYGVNREISRLDVSFDKLDSKLQREQSLGSEVSQRDIRAVTEDLRLAREQIIKLEQRQWDRVVDENRDLKARKVQ